MKKETMKCSVPGCNNTYKESQPNKNICPRCNYVELSMETTDMANTKNPLKKLVKKWIR